MYVVFNGLHDPEENPVGKDEKCRVMFST